jgi:hypothetical protein
MDYREYQVMTEGLVTKVVLENQDLTEFKVLKVLLANLVLMVQLVVRDHLVTMEEME